MRLESKKPNYCGVLHDLFASLKINFEFLLSVFFVFHANSWVFYIDEAAPIKWARSFDFYFCQISVRNF